MTEVTEESVRRMVRDLWLRNRPVTLERLAVVQAALDRLARGGLDDDERERARTEAHKLRGILGTYGFEGASEVVGDAEDLLGGDADAGGAAEVGTRLDGCARDLAADAEA